jgi:hypothetical protein
VQKYLLASTSREPQCMACSKPWNREFLQANMTRAWMLGAYKEHRERMLLERETALLPDSQYMVENYRAASQIKDHITALEEERRHIEKSLEDARRNYTLFSSNGYKGARLAAPATDSKDQKAFVRACPVDGCRGFLSTAWKCGVCETYVCPACHEVKRSRDDERHVCDPANVATAKLLAKDSRPCPSCAVLIYKIEGCDQMWCTACHTPFSWRTGKVITHGTLHNPHYYDYLRRTRGAVPRAPEDIPCGGLCDYRTLMAHLRQQGVSVVQRNALSTIHRNVSHVRDVDMRGLADEFRVTDNADLRLAYLLKQINEHEWKRKLQQREKKRSKDMEVRQVLDTYCTVAADSFQKLSGGHVGVDDTLTELCAVQQFAASKIAEIARAYNVTMRDYFNRM